MAGKFRLLHYEVEINGEIAGHPCFFAADCEDSDDLISMCASGLMHDFADDYDARISWMYGKDIPREIHFLSREHPGFSMTVRNFVSDPGTYTAVDLCKMPDISEKAKEFLRKLNFDELVDSVAEYFAQREEI